MEKKGSDILKEFLDYVAECRRLEMIASEEIKKEDGRLQDFLHFIEFEPTAKERSKACTAFRASRVERRKYKDIYESVNPTVEFFSAKDTKTIKHNDTYNDLTQLLGILRKIEKYHENRKYIKRVSDEERDKQ